MPGPRTIGELRSLRRLRAASTIVLALAVLAALVAPSSDPEPRIMAQGALEPQLLVAAAPSHTGAADGAAPDTAPVGPGPGDTAELDAAPPGGAPSIEVAATEPAAPTPTPTSDCGGTPLAKPTGGTWQCTFDDEFDGTTLDTTKWVVQVTAESDYHSGNECFVDSPDNVSVGGGVLSLTARRETSKRHCPTTLGGYDTWITSGMVSTWGLFTQAFGRFEVRARVPATAVKGLQSSFWLYPQSQTYGSVQHSSGEIDIAEIFSQYSDRAIPYVHYLDGGLDPHVTNNDCYVSDTSQFHTYAVEWTTSSLTFTYDGTTCLVDRWDPLVGDRPRPFDRPFLLCLTQALGIGTNAFDPARTPLPATTQIDYARIWR